MSRFEIKIVCALLLIAVIPLVASVHLVGQVIRVSDSVAEGQARRLAQPLERAADGYRRLFAALKESFRLKGELLSRDAALGQAAATGDTDALAHRLQQILDGDKDLYRLALLDSRGKTLATVTSRARASSAVRELRLTFQLGRLDARLVAVFHAALEPFDDFRQLGQAQRAAVEIAGFRDELATYYRVVFLIMFGGVLVAATVAGLVIARRTARRVTLLAGATRKVAEGDLDTRVTLDTRDELGDLARAFNEMVGELKENRERIAYLEKIGAWQEIARRLAHEIKNPLTPIQLAVQQLHRKYSREDPEFSRLLDDARDIVSEEIEGLRRLVHAFSAFAKLPVVQPRPESINVLVDDLFKSHPELQQRGQIRWEPARPTCLVLVDRQLFRHVLLNLIENASQAAEEAGMASALRVEIVAALDESRGRLTLTVSDNGPGMEPATLERVFEPYFTTREKGTGLGLAIVKKIVLEHRGSINVSAQPGRGARFTLTLPLAETPRRGQRVTGPLLPARGH